MHMRRWNALLVAIALLLTCSSAYGQGDVPLRSRRVQAAQWVSSISSAAESIVRTADCMLWTWGVGNARCESLEAQQRDPKQHHQQQEGQASSSWSTTAAGVEEVAHTTPPHSQRVHDAASLYLQQTKRPNIGLVQPRRVNKQKEETKESDKDATSNHYRPRPLRRSDLASSGTLGSTLALPAGSTFDSIRLSVFTSNGPASILPAATTKRYCYLGQTSIAIGTTDGTTVTWTNDTDLPNFVCTNGNSSTSVTAKEFQELPASNRSHCAVNTSHPAYVPQCVCPSDYFLFQTTTTFYGCLPRNFSCSTSFSSTLLSQCHLPGYAEPERAFDRCLSLTKDTDSASLAVNVSCTSDGVATLTNLYASFGAVVATPPSSSGSAATAWMPVTAVMAAEDQQPTGTYQQLVVDRAVFPNYFGTATTSASSNLTNSSSSVFLLSTFHPIAQYGALELEFFDFNSPSHRNGSRVLYRLGNASSSYSVLPAPPTSSLQSSATSNVNEAEGGWGALESGFWHVTIPLSEVPERTVAGGRLYLEMGLVAPYGLVQRYSVSAMQIDLLDARFTAPSGAIRKYTQPMDAGTVALIAVLTAVAVGLVLVVIWKLCHREAEVEDDSIGAIKKQRRVDAAKKNQ